MDNNTIAAISTALSEGGIGIIRLSGDDSIVISDKIFKTQSDTGKITVPASGDGGDCELITNTGKIDIEVVKK